MLNNRNKWEQGAGLGKRVSTQKGGVMRKKKRADKGEAQGGVGNAEKKNGKEQSTKIPDKNSKKFKKKHKNKIKNAEATKNNEDKPSKQKPARKAKEGKIWLKKLKSRERQKSCCSFSFVQSRKMQAKKFTKTRTKLIKREPMRSYGTTERIGENEQTTVSAQ